MYKRQTATWADKNLTNTYWDTAEFDNLIPTGSDPVALKAQKVQDIIKQAYPKMINAASPEEVDKIYNQMLADCEADVYKRQFQVIVVVSSLLSTIGSLLAVS